MLWLEVDKDSLKAKTNTIIGVIYRRPGSDISTFNNMLSNNLATIQSEHKACIHVGDYNLNLLKAGTHPPTNEFTDINFEHSFFPLITKPTRITSTSATLIDNIFSNKSDTTDCNSGILLWAISDHYPIFFISYKDTINTEINYRLGRSHSEKNKIKFTNSLRDINWLPVTSNPDSQASYSSFHEIISKAYNSSFPITKTKIGYKTRLSWLTSGLKHSIQTKHKLHTAYLKKTSLDNKIIIRLSKTNLQVSCVQLKEPTTKMN
jgi:hypothetical protein